MTDVADIKTPEQVRRLLEDRTPESDVLDFKQQIDNKQAARALAALANTRGGQIIFGIIDVHSRASDINMLDLEGSAEKVSSIAREGIDEPLVLSDATPVYLDGEHGVLVVKVDPSERAPHFVTGQGFIRSGPTTRPMTAHEIGALFARRGEAFISEFRVEASRPADVIARIDTERRQTGMDNRGGIKEQTNRFLVLENRGEEDCRDVHYKFLRDDGEEAAFPRPVEERPVRHLRAGTEVKVPVSVAMGGTYASEIRLSWKDGGDNEHERIQSIHV